MKKLDRSLKWKCDTPSLLKEILSNPGTWALQQPLNLFALILAEVADRAIQLDDPILNELMCDLKLYDMPDQSKPEYSKIMKEVRKKASDCRIKLANDGK